MKRCLDIFRGASSVRRSDMLIALAALKIGEALPRIGVGTSSFAGHGHASYTSYCLPTAQ